MRMFSRELNWRAIWQSLGEKSLYSKERSFLEGCYSEPSRQYHNLKHLDECLSLFERMHSQFEDPTSSALAIWFHDAVYDVRAKDNEEKSAQLALEFLRNTNLDKSLLQKIYNLVLATSHQSLPDSQDAALIQDIDLAILGSSSMRFEEYNQAIRQEYSFVPDEAFFPARSQILSSFLRKKTIYYHFSMQDLFEKRARINLARWLEDHPV